MEQIVVPPAISPGQSTRIHAVFRTNADIKAHWNNEVEDLVLWVDPPEGWIVSEQRLTAPRPREIVSQEPRRVEFEVRAPKEAHSGVTRIPAYALYYVCEDVNGACLYRRQDLSFQVLIR